MQPIIHFYTLVAEVNTETLISQIRSKQTVRNEIYFLKHFMSERRLEIVKKNVLFYLFIRFQI